MSGAVVAGSLVIDVLPLDTSHIQGQVIAALEKASAAAKLSVSLNMGQTTANLSGLEFQILGLTDAVKMLGSNLGSMAQQAAQAGSRAKAGLSGVDLSVTEAARSVRTLLTEFQNGGVSADVFSREMLNARGALELMRTENSLGTRELQLISSTLNTAAKAYGEANTAASPYLMGLKEQKAAAQSLSQTSAALNSEILQTRRAWQEGSLGAEQMDKAMQSLYTRSQALLAPLEAQKAAILALGVPTREETVQLERLTLQMNGLSMASQRAAAGMDAANSRITRGSLAAGVQAGVAGLSGALKVAVADTERLMNAERAGLLTKEQYTLALAGQTAAHRASLLAVEREALGLRELGVLDVQQTARLEQLVLAQNGYTASLARTVTAQNAAAVAARGAVGAALGMRGAGGMGNAAMALSFISPQAGMLAMAASMGPVVAGAAAVALGVGSIVKLTKEGETETKKLQTAYNILRVNGNNDLGAISASLDNMASSGSKVFQQFSKAELGTALASLARGGEKGAEGLTVLATSTKLAVAEHVNLDDATKRLYNNLQHFNLGANDSAGFADKLAQAAHLSMASMDELSKGLNVFGAVAKDSGASIDETLGYLVALAKKGMDPATIGATGLRNVMLALTKPSKSAGEAIQSLGVNLQTADGHARKANDVLTDLRAVANSTAPVYDKLNGKLLNHQDIMQRVATIFRTRGLTAFLGLTEAADVAAEHIQHSNGMLDKFSQGMTNGLEPAQKRLDAATKNLSLTFFQTFAPSLAAATDGVTVAVRALGNLSEHANEAKPYLVGLGIAVTALGVRAIATTAIMKELMLAQAMGGIANVASVAATALQLRLIPAITGVTAATSAFIALNPVTLFAVAGGALALYSAKILDDITNIRTEIEGLNASGDKALDDQIKKGGLAALEAKRSRLLNDPTGGVTPGGLLGTGLNDTAATASQLAARKTAIAALDSQIAAMKGTTTSLGLLGGTTPHILNEFGVGGANYHHDGFSNPNAVHHGVDLGAARGTPIYAPFEGNLTARRDAKNGNIFELTDAAGAKLVGLHLDQFSASVKQALMAGGGKALIQRGTQIGTVGNTGTYAGASPHLHTEGILPDGTKVDFRSIKYQGIGAGTPNFASIKTPPQMDPNFKPPAISQFTAEAQHLYNQQVEATAQHNVVWLAKINSDIAAFKKLHAAEWAAVSQISKKSAAEAKAALNDAGVSDADLAKYGAQAQKIALAQSKAADSTNPGDKAKADRDQATFLNANPAVAEKVLSYYAAALSKKQALNDAANRQADQDAKKAQAEAEKAAKDAERARQDAAKARADTMKALREDDVKAAQANLNRLKEVQDRALALDKDNLVKQLADRKLYAKQVHDLQIQINQAEYDQAEKDANNGRKQERRGLIRTAQTNLDTGNLAARNAQDATVRTATDAVTQAVQKQRDAYHQLAEGIRKQTDAGTFDAQAQHDALVTFNELGRETDKLGLSTDKGIIKSRTITFALTEQGHAAYLTAQRNMGMVSGNEEAANSALQLATDLAGLGDTQGQLATLQQTYDQLTVSLSRGEASAGDVDKVRLALEALQSSLGTESAVNDWLSTLDGSIDDQLAAITDKLADPNTTVAFKKQLQTVTQDFGQGAATTGGMGEAATQAAADQTARNIGEARNLLQNLTEATGGTLQSIMIQAAALLASEIGKSLPAEIRDSIQAGIDGAKAGMASLSDVLADPTKFADGSRGAAKPPEAGDVAAETARTEKLFTDTQSRTAAHIGIEQQQLERAHQEGLVSQAGYISQRQLLTEQAARTEFETRTRGLKESEPAYKQAEEALQAALTAAAAEGAADRKRAQERAEADAVTAARAALALAKRDHGDSSGPRAALGAALGKNITSARSELAAMNPLADGYAAKLATIQDMEGQLKDVKLGATLVIAGFDTGISLFDTYESAGNIFGASMTSHFAKVAEGAESMGQAVSASLAEMTVGVIDQLAKQIIATEAAALATDLLTGNWAKAALDVVIIGAVAAGDGLFKGLMTPGSSSGSPTIQNPSSGTGGSTAASAASSAPAITYSLTLNNSFAITEGLDSPGTRQKLAAMQEQTALQIMDRAGLIRLPAASPTAGA